MIEKIVILLIILGAESTIIYILFGQFKQQQLKIDLLSQALEKDEDDGKTADSRKFK